MVISADHHLVRTGMKLEKSKRKQIRRFEEGGDRRPRNVKCGNIAGGLRDENYSSTERTRKNLLDVLGGKPLDWLNSN